MREQAGSDGAQRESAIQSLKADKKRFDGELKGGIEEQGQLARLKEETRRPSANQPLMPKQGRQFPRSVKKGAKFEVLTALNGHMIFCGF
jgi:hypothetical protein